MSYSCDFSFKAMSPSEIIPFLVSFKHEASRKLKDIAKEYHIFCPQLQKSRTPTDFKDFSVQERVDAREWTTSIFRYKYFYNEELGLLGVSGVPNALRHLFDGTVHFQNHTDHDYDIELYAGIEPFMDIYDHWQGKTNAEIRQIYFESRNRYLEDEFFEEYPEALDDSAALEKRLDYVRRSFAYEEIWSHFEANFWDDDNQIHFALFDMRADEASKFFKYCHDAYLELEEELRKGV